MTPKKTWKRLLPKECIVCGDKFVRRYGEQVREFNKRATCDKICGGVYSWQQRQELHGPTGCRELPDAVVENWSCLSPSAQAVKLVLGCHLNQVSRIARRKGVRLSYSPNPNLECLTEFMRAEQLYSGYREQGLSYGA